MKLLIIDDEANLRRTLTAVLQRRGFTIYSAADGESGLYLFRHEKPDLVLTDLSMPGMSGLELLKRIKAERPAVPVLMMTAYGSIESAVEAMKAGAADYVTKPFAMEEIALKIDKALQLEELKRRQERLEE